jgi:hypothetical protein
MKAVEMSRRRISELLDNQQGVTVKFFSSERPDF